jgi:putative ABC transport system ATP-binding protein
VAVARALANQPKVIFADEPTGNLDSKNREEFMACMKELHGQGVTILMVTHDPILAQVAERQITIIDGRIQP